MPVAGVDSDAFVARVMGWVSIFIEVVVPWTMASHVCILKLLVHHTNEYVEV